MDITKDIKELNKKDKTNKITRSKFKKNKKVKVLSFEAKN